MAKAQVFRADIQYVVLEDTLLIESLSEIIAIEEKGDSLFANGYGYLNVGINEEVRRGANSLDTLRSYEISVSFAHPNEDQNKLMPFYPKYYSLVNDRLVTFDLPARSIAFSKTSILIYEEIIEKHLAPKDSPSRKTLWRLNYQYNVAILQNRINGEYEKPIVSKVYF
ncbi:hypothetical protein BFP97_12645 [Roseivirga sp. 4D4]|nr:hypothetical protein BFP97_12645 [Roseivirga sp. 4D4]